MGALAAVRALHPAIAGVEVAAPAKVKAVSLVGAEELVARDILDQVAGAGGRDHSRDQGLGLRHGAG